jgi:hypothetical protein
LGTPHTNLKVQSLFVLSGYSEVKEFRDPHRLAFVEAVAAELDVQTATISITTGETG